MEGLELTLISPLSPGPVCPWAESHATTVHPPAKRPRSCRVLRRTTNGRLGGSRSFWIRECGFWPVRTAFERCVTLQTDKRPSGERRLSPPPDAATRPVPSQRVAVSLGHTNHRTGQGQRRRHGGVPYRADPGRSDLHGLHSDPQGAIEPYDEYARRCRCPRPPYPLHQYHGGVSGCRT